MNFKPYLLTISLIRIQISSVGSFRDLLIFAGQLLSVTFLRLIIVLWISMNLEIVLLVGVVMERRGVNELLNSQKGCFVRGVLGWELSEAVLVGELVEENGEAVGV